MKPEAIIFDLDGTMWSSTNSICIVWNRFLKEQGIDFEVTHEEMNRLMGKTMEEIGEVIFSMFSPQKRVALINTLSVLEVEYLNEHGGVLYPNLKETLCALAQRYQLYIVSNCQCGYAESFMHAHHVSSCFTDIEMSGRTGKPKADNIRILMERNQIKNAVYVGDTSSDLAAATLAGIPFVYASYGFGEVDHYDYKIETFAELCTLF